jgi:hypothetical protein
MLKVHILDKCKHCNAKAYQPIGEGENCHGNKYVRFSPCGTDHIRTKLSLGFH